MFYFLKPVQIAVANSFMAFMKIFTILCSVDKVRDRCDI